MVIAGWNAFTSRFLKSAEVATGGVLYKKVFLEISQNSQENKCARVSFLIKLQAYFIKKETLAQVFPCEFCEISKNTFSQNTSGRLLLNLFMFFYLEWAETGNIFWSGNLHYDNNIFSIRKHVLTPYQLLTILPFVLL